MSINREIYITMAIYSVFCRAWLIKANTGLRMSSVFLKLNLCRIVPTSRGVSNPLATSHTFEQLMYMFKQLGSWLVSKAVSKYQRVVSKCYFPMSKLAENRTIYWVIHGHHLSTVCCYVHMSIRNLLSLKCFPLGQKHPFWACKRLYKHDLWPI